MPRSVAPLLCELHAHTRWSDGSPSVAELVGLYARNGFDVCITDHAVRSDDPWRAREGVEFNSPDEGSWSAQLAEVAREASRAWATYGMLVLPGSS